LLLARDGRFNTVEKLLVDEKVRFVLLAKSFVDAAFVLQTRPCKSLVTPT
jgi:hypothetical protein